MEVIVVDTSVVLKWYAAEEHAEAAETLHSPGRELHAPDLLLIEVDNVLCTWLRSRGVDEAKAQTIRAALRSAGVRLHISTPLLDPAFDLAAGTGVSIYDSLYVALAEQLDAEMVTSDERLLRDLKGTAFAKRVVHVADFARRK